MDVRKFAVNPTGRLHLKDADGNLMYADGADGQPDKSKPMVVVVYGHGSKQHSKWTALSSNRFIQRLKKKGGKADQTEDEARAERIEMLGIHTESFENIAYDDKTGSDLFEGVYGDATLGFIADQVAEYIADWGNFSKPSTAA